MGALCGTDPEVCLLPISSGEVLGFDSMLWTDKAEPCPSPIGSNLLMIDLGLKGP